MKMFKKFKDVTKDAQSDYAIVNALSAQADKLLDEAMNLEHVDLTPEPEKSTLEKAIDVAQRTIASHTTRRNDLASAIKDMEAELRLVERVLEGTHAMLNVLKVPNETLGQPENKPGAKKS